MSISIRTYQPMDEPAIIEITFKTGLVGEDLTGRGYCDDARLWYLIFIGYYASYEPENFFVAAESETDKVVGFICGTPDTRMQEVHFRKKMVPRIGLRFFGYTSWRYPHTFKTVFGLLRYYISNPENAGNDHIIKQYPAHLHINLLPDFQSQGMGTRLMKHFEAHMMGLGVQGIHLGTTNKNHKAVPFYHKMGFEIVRESEIMPHPLFDDLRHLTFAKKLDTQPVKTY